MCAHFKAPAAPLAHTKNIQGAFQGYNHCLDRRVILKAWPLLVACAVFISHCVRSCCLLIWNLEPGAMLQRSREVLTKPKARTEQKNMCHMVSVMGNGNPARAHHIQIKL